MSRSAGSMTGKEAFMQNIASRLGRREPLQKAPERPFIGVPDFYRDRELSTNELIEEFIRNWTALSGRTLIVEEAEAPQAIAAYLKEVCAELGITRISRWEHDRLRELSLDGPLIEAGIEVVPWREDGADHLRLAEPPTGSEGNWAKRSKLLQAAETCRLGLVWPDCAVANTSTLALFSEGGKGRSVSLLTDTLVAVFRADQIVTRMGEAFALFKERYPNVQQMASSLNLITGPSRSADIENDLTIGIHGPGKVHAVIIR
ncbi:LutC/YkgG family protein [Paenibacillus abyssi]|uniref:Lactate utilization protein C n=1 Tax=Paenibacillus abyssi TaxID=1340531 RepID=A0A917CVJ0_9BACL|nr:lactate utilization protein C [Paenibacillus abyssi]GGF99686.1 lactate utilization protein C [Paenibacillus abyssi]